MYKKVPTTLNFVEREKETLKFWKDNQIFEKSVQLRQGAPAYTFFDGPPTANGKPHIGHVLTRAMKDIIPRYKTMRGYDVLRKAGWDTHGLPVELEVEKELGLDGKEQIEQYGVIPFIQKCKESVWKYKGEWEVMSDRMGFWADMDNPYITYDNDYIESEWWALKAIYEKGLLYKGHKIVPYCPRCGTALSSHEVAQGYKEVKETSATVRFRVPDEENTYFLAWTTTPWTLPSNVSLCVNPDDERYAWLPEDARVIVPLVGRSVPVIRDTYVDIAFGTGALKVTPAHDVNDYMLGEKYGLESIDIFNDDGTINDKVGLYAGMERFALRKQIEKDLDAAGLLEKTEDYTNNVGYSERTGVAIEPKLSMQWFLSMEKLAGPATQAVLENEIKLVPEKYKNTYRHWMENIKDWCISRQLWWGQRIPAWYLPQGGYVVALNADEALEKARAKSGDASLTLADLRQDEDVLDTWFSSWLWPISVFDGIRHPNNKDIEYYYPTNDLVTGPDIIFFWVARMIMAGYEYRGEKPFGHVYFTGIVRDKIGRKMSKQLGNSPDPLDLIAQFGADGMRVAMLLSSSAGNDVMFDEALCEQGRNFGNKIWNAYRLVNGWTIDDTLAQSENNRLAIEWFRQALAKTLRQVESDFASYRISEAFMNLYKLFWDDFSGWYLEMIKPAYQCPIDRPTLEATCGFFDDLLRLLHPFMPFVTEEIWQDLAPRKAGESIMVQRMPEAREIDEALLGRFELTKEVVTAVRNVRKQKNIPQKDPLTLRVIADENYPAEYAPVLQKMGNLSQIETTREKDPSAVGFLVKTTQYFVPMEGMIDIEAERKKLAGELEYLEGFLASVQKKLSNERFVSSAPEKVVANERTKQADAEAKIAALREQLAALK